MAYKPAKIALFMRHFQTQLKFNYKDHCFIDSTFYSPHKAGYQIMNFRIHNIKENIFYTLANAILCDKEKSTYIELFSNLSIYITENQENKRNNVSFSHITIHTDFEQGLIGASKQV